MPPKLLDENYIHFVKKKLQFVQENEWPKFVFNLKKNGVWQQFMNKNELHFIKIQAFLNQLEHGESQPRSYLLNEPCPQFFPCFNLANKPVQPIAAHSWTRLLQDNFSTIYDEIMKLPEEAYVQYNFDGQMNLMKALAFYDKGKEIIKNTQKCSKTIELLKTIPSLCANFPLCNIVISKMPPGTHLPKHCSADNLRMRTMLGIDTPKNCFLRVCDWEYSWQEGEVFLWEDSFEHEAANYSERDRIILIFDTWHPDLTKDEINFFNIFCNHFPTVEL